MSSAPSSDTSPSITIHYCPACGWLLRSAWMAQEILTTFAEDVSGVTLAPAPQGTFRITAMPSGDTLWDRRVDGGFPDVKELKRRVRDAVAPAKPLGHLDRSR